MKSLTVFLALTMLLSLTCVRAEEETSSDSFSEEKIGRWWYPYYPPYHYPRHHHHLPNPKPKPVAAAHPPVPAHHGYPPEVVQCWSDRVDLGRQCHAAVVKAFWTRNPDLGAECCASILKWHSDCEKLVFAAFHNPYFNCFIKLHCATSSGSTPPSAPAPSKSS